VGLNSVAVDPSGDVFVADTSNNAVKEIVPGTGGAASGKVSSTSTVIPVGSGFNGPKGVAVDRNGYAYIVDAATQVVQIFDPEGRLMLFFGEAGASTRGEVVLPAAVKVDIVVI